MGIAILLCLSCHFGPPNKESRHVAISVLQQVDGKAEVADLSSCLVMMSLVTLVACGHSRSMSAKYKPHLKDDNGTKSKASSNKTFEGLREAEEKPR